MTSNAIDTIPTPASPSALARADQDELVPFGAHTSDLVLWAYEAQQAQQIAKALAKTSFVPVSLRGKPDDIMAAILAGSELGMKPMATLRSIDVIQGTPALRAHAQRALVQSHGHSVQLVESTESMCRMRGRRKGEEEWQEVEWDLKRADGLRLLEKSEWKKQPKTMLVARATGEICRLVAADVLHAMPYNAEELRDSEYSDAEGSTPRVTVAELAASVKSALPAETPREPIRVDVETPTPGPSMKDQIVALFAEVGLHGADERAAYVAETIGHDVASFGEMTDAEVNAVHVALTRFAAQLEPTVGDPT